MGVGQCIWMVREVGVIHSGLGGGGGAWKKHLSDLASINKPHD